MDKLHYLQLGAGVPNEQIYKKYISSVTTNVLTRDKLI